MRILSRAIALGLFGTCLAMLLFSVGSLLQPTAAHFPNRPNVGDVIVFGSTFLTFPGVALAIIWKRPRNPVGWLFLAIGLAVTISVFAGEYVNWPLYGGVDLPGSTFVAWAGSWAFNAVGTSFLPFALMLFPDGRLPSRRWRPAAAIALVVGTVATAALAVIPGPLAEAEPIENPFGASGVIGDVAAELAAAQLPALAYVTILGIAALVARFRRGGIERQQVKWILWPSALFVGALLGALANELLQVAPEFEGLWLVMIITLAALPVCAGIAILRYRLYDIDVVIRRTLVYALVIGVLGAAYGAMVLTLTTVLSRFAGAQAAPVALATLIIAALFGPVRDRVRTIVDRRFFRSRYDAQRTLELFSTRLRDQVELDVIGGTLVDVVGQTVRPASVGIWLRS